MLPRHYRLKKEADFKKVLQTGRYRYNSFFTIKYIKTGISHSRFGIIISSKVSKKAVIRNRLKRQISAFLYHQDKSLVAGYDVVFIVKKELVGKSFSMISESLMDLLQKAKLI